MSAGTSVTESSAAAAIAKVLVSASGRNSRPSWSSRVNTGRNDSVMMRSDMNSRSEEHTSELQSRLHLVCRLLLEKKKKNQQNPPHSVIYAPSTMIEVVTPE